MTPPITGIVYTGQNQYGDIAWMIQQSTYSNCLFIFADVIEWLHKNSVGNGAAWSRQYTINNPQMAPPLAANVPVASIKRGAYASMAPENKTAIDGAITVIQNLLHAHTYDHIYYAATAPNSLIYTGIYNVDSTVRSYVTNAILGL